MEAPPLTELVPNGHKYALRVIDAPVSGLGGVSHVAPGLQYVPALPASLPESWREWVGKREVFLLRRCKLVLLATEPANDPLDDGESIRDLDERLQRLYGALSIVTPGFSATYGHGLTGVHRTGEITVSNHSYVVPYYSAPGTPKGWNVTKRHLDDAARVAAAMGEMRAGVDGRTDRLMRMLFAFHQGMSATTWDVRVHQFCRVLDGCVASGAGSGRRHFRERCLTIILDDAGQHRDFFEKAYAVRGSVEHLRGPAAEIREMMPELDSDAKAYLHLAYLAFLIEHVARHAMYHLCSVPQLWAPMRDHRRATELWNDAARARELWASPLDLKPIQRAFDRDATKRALGLVD